MEAYTYNLALMQRCQGRLFMASAVVCVSVCGGGGGGGERGIRPFL